MVSFICQVALLSAKGLLLLWQWKVVLSSFVRVSCRSSLIEVNIDGGSWQTGLLLRRCTIQTINIDRMSSQLTRLDRLQDVSVGLLQGWWHLVLLLESFQEGCNVFWPFHLSGPLLNRLFIHMVQIS